MSSESVKVMVRCRPLNQREQQINPQICVSLDSQVNQVQLTHPKEDTQKMFIFDSVFDVSIAHSQIYEKSAFSLVESVVEGYNGTIFAYGQTGCGKTFTMTGVANNEDLKGIIPRTFMHIIGEMESQEGKNFLLRCSFIEIYNEDIHDLLSSDVKAKYEMKECPEKGVFIKDLNQIVCKSIADLDKHMQTGTKNRSTGETLMNKDSSRSHSIFTIYLEASYNDHITAGKLNLVDLAGSERLVKTQATGDRLKEATKINLSLSALGNVISALVDGKSSHIPYRDSKLTRLLQDSLGGNTKTVMIACISPSAFNYDEILGTLRYASRAKNIQNKPKINEDPKDAMLREYELEIKKLKELLEGKTLENGGNYINNRTDEGSKYIPTNSNKLEYESELLKREEQLANEKIEREKLESQLQEYQNKFYNGGDPASNDSLKKDYLKMKKKLKKQRKMEEQLRLEQEEKTKILNKVENKYKNMNEEMEELRRINNALAENLENAYKEIKDIQNENELEKEELLETIRVSEKENKLHLTILNRILKNGEIEKIKKKSNWNDDEKEFEIYPFFLRNRKILFPKIKNSPEDLEQIDTEKEEREIGFLDENNEKNKSPIRKKNVEDLSISNNQVNQQQMSYKYHNSLKKINDVEKNYFDLFEPNSTLMQCKKKINVQLEPIKHGGIYSSDSKFNGHTNNAKRIKYI